MKLKTPKELGITKTQFKNLCKLITFVRKSVPPPTFNIETHHSEADYPIKATYECGTTACFCGYGPLAKIKPRKNEDWHDYSERVFGCAPSYWRTNRDLWTWLFSEHHENSKEAACQRGAYFLVNGLPNSPDGFAINYSNAEVPKNFKTPWKLIEEAAK